MVVMEGPSGDLATPRRDGVLATSRRQAAVNTRNIGGKAENSNVKLNTANNPETFEKSHKREVRTPRNGKVYIQRSRVNRANGTRIWHIYN